MQRRHIQSPDGLSLALWESARPGAASWVFLHGIAQSAESWQPVFDGSLAATQHLVAWDLRGHGDSDKPDDDGAYVRGALADDLAAVLACCEGARPTVVAWSYGGVVLGEYLRRYGDGALGGIVCVAAAVKTGRDARTLYGPVMLDHARALLSDDARVYAAGARDFLRGCAATELPEAVLARMMTAMGRVPARARRALLSGAEDYTAAYARTTVPLTVIQGEADGVVRPAMSALVAPERGDVVRRALPGVGHLPWYEAPEDFDEELLAHAARVRGYDVPAARA